jgi:nucleoside-diphosphate-sugar epimerase
MKILVTGTDGYLGSILAPRLLALGHTLTCVDTGFYADGLLYGDTPTIDVLKKDIREINEQDLAGHDAVVHMAELSNDPTGELAPDITYKINHQASVRLATLSKAAGVKRFIYMSSCSVYGVGSGDFVTEKSDTNPQTAYAICKTYVERDVSSMADGSFSPVFMRNATAYGASQRMRFDIVLNNLSALAHTTKTIALLSDGSPWRPLVHAQDIAGAIETVLAADAGKIHNEIFNVGDTGHNYQVRDIAEFVAAEYPDCELTFGALPSDNRSYRVSFDKIHIAFPEYICHWTAAKGARQLKELFTAMPLTKELFQAPPFTRLKALEKLIHEGRIDSDFFWRKTDA